MADKKSKLRVFIVDDSAIVRERLTSMLSEMKDVEIVGQARDAYEASDSIRKLKPDAAILDIRLPGRSGIELLELIKEEQPGLVVIMLTLYPYRQYRERCLKAGANYFFDKSTGFEKIPELFQRLAGKFDRTLN